MQSGSALLKIKLCGNFWSESSMSIPHHSGHENSIYCVPDVKDRVVCHPGMNHGISGRYINNPFIS